MMSKMLIGWLGVIVLSILTTIAQKTLDVQVKGNPTSRVLYRILTLLEGAAIGGLVAWATMR